ncbi:MAG: hypothetical protein HY744_27555 [Deltaproteobacteria bacterium]|nr:hypothetical protein [Deltaproteobacteria bacterium]
MSSAAQSQVALADQNAAPEDRAARVRAMLARWAAEDARDEPDWDIEQIERLRFRQLVAEPEHEGEGEQ